MLADCALGQCSLGFYLWSSDRVDFGGLLLGDVVLGEYPLAGGCAPWYILEEWMYGRSDFFLGGGILATYPLAGGDKLTLESLQTLNILQGAFELSTTAVSITDFVSEGTLWPVSGSFILSAVGAETDIRPGFFPSFLIDGYTSDGVNITIPIASLAGLSVAEADAVTGDWREIFQSLLLTAHTYMETVQGFEHPLTTDINVITNWNARHPVLGLGVKRRISQSFNINFPVSRLTTEG